MLEVPVKAAVTGGKGWECHLSDLQAVFRCSYMMQWKNLEADVTPARLVSYLCTLSLLDQIAVIHALMRGPALFFQEKARRTIVRHVRGRKEERGGLLLGKAMTPGELNSAFANPLVYIAEAVPAVDFRGTSVSLEMDSSVWTSASVTNEAGLMVVGWFHSHPNLGAFFSGTDCRTHRNFFAHEYSVGYVVDPVREDHAYFIGAECTRVGNGNVVDISEGTRDRLFRQRAGNGP